MLKLPPDHPQRRLLAEEAHARPFETVPTPARVTYVAVLIDGESRAAEQAHVAKLCALHGAAPPAPGEAPVAPTPAARDAAWQREWQPDAVMLFRYSALTFNGHRIHYDRPYVTGEEGYPGLVVHGPLLATLLLDLLRRHAPRARVESFRFSARRPTFDGRPLRVHGQPDASGRVVRLWASDDEGWLTLDGEARLA